MSLKRNSIYSLISSVLPVIGALATVPLYIREIGSDRYGALVIAWTMLGYFGQADFGIGRAVTQRISASRGAGAKEQAGIIWSGIVAILGIGLATGLIVYLAAGYFFGDVMKVEPGLRAELVASIWALALCNPVIALTGVSSGALIGVEKFKFVSVSYLVSNLGLQVFPLIVAWTLTHDLQWLIVASLGGRVLGLLMMGLAVWRSFLAGHRPAPRKSEMRGLAHFGMWVMVTSLVAPLMIASDRFVIGALDGPLAVAVYTIPFQVAYRTLMLPQSVVSVLFPRFAALGGDEARERGTQFTAFIGQMFAPFVIGIACLADPLMHLWLGSHLDPRSVPVAQVILLGVWYLALGSVPFSLIQARGNPRFAALAVIAELPFYFAMLYLLGTSFGLVGIAAAFAIRAAADAMICAWRAGVPVRFMARHVLPTALLVLGTVLVGPMISGWLQALLAATVLCSASVVILLLSLGDMPDDIRVAFEKMPVIGPLIARLALRRAAPKAG
ncbi:flippase [Novosphingobium sp. SL115]|uniref:flippase n=1 Tax=Novosphingobium sp. SL115 TaxID=2995150 RepID=UPI002272FFC1|nr:flippase [Novosphingobium sp. SL115]MCY1670656.1 flippase [Novosphingobium sp. SL115]